MKQYILYILALVVASLSFQSCEFEASDNGDLDGNWQLMQVDTIATGGRNKVKNQQLFYSVQMRLLCLKEYNAAAESNLFFHFEHTNDSLKLKSASSDGKAMYPVSMLRPLIPLHRISSRFQPTFAHPSDILLKQNPIFY